MSALEQEASTWEEFHDSYSLLHKDNPCHHDIWLIGIENRMYREFVL